MSELTYIQMHKYKHKFKLFQIVTEFVIYMHIIYQGEGRFGVYCSRRPIKVTIDDCDVETSYDFSTGLLEFQLRGVLFLRSRSYMFFSLHYLHD